MQSLDRSQHSRRPLVTDVISHHDSNGWLPRTSLLDQLQNAAAVAATRALVSVAATCRTLPYLWAEQPDKQHPMWVRGLYVSGCLSK